MAEAPLQQHPAVAHESTTVTLLVRHLPEAIPHDTLTRLFSHYAASSVRPCSHGRLKNCAFVDFKNETSASQAQKQLHRLRFLGKVLSVERASKAIEDTKHKKSETQTRKDTDSMMKDASVPKVSSDHSRGGHSHASEPIAEKLGVDYPFPPILSFAFDEQNEYSCSISQGTAYSTSTSIGSCSPPPPPPSSETNMEHLSSSESEMESSDEDVRGDAGPRRKRVKRQAIVGPAVDKEVAHEAVGLKQVALVPKEKPIIKKKNPVLQIKIAPKQVQAEARHDDAGKEAQEPRLETFDHEPYATLEELNSGKLPPEEILSLPRFKNYTAGDPSPVLYIKNLAKDVVVDDFYFIFGSFFGSIDAAKSNLSVKLMQRLQRLQRSIVESCLVSDELRVGMMYCTKLLIGTFLESEPHNMHDIFLPAFIIIFAAEVNSLHFLQEGRMRGQAFITFPTVELARNALNMANGYVFKGKPIVIQFGRNPAAAKAN
ncbi:UNVERIFIED_CONTAM: U11/U12 small nuclear ribonucleoprotein [Sesamum latifolium]|uniref:U11/U12 small nuclear ribonucleoprotein n=1 Tax=Sesamum latifolium TaxID=2727402 RepID=A0AAW2UZQ6_9LAMI